MQPSLVIWEESKLLIKESVYDKPRSTLLYVYDSYNMSIAKKDTFPSWRCLSRGDSLDALKVYPISLKDRTFYWL